MAAPLFRQSVFARTARRTLPTVPQCRECGLDRRCNSPKMPVHGEGRRKILVLGEAGGWHEDKQGRQFVGPSGDLLRDLMRRYGVELRSDCWTHNALSCYPTHPSGKRRNPLDKEIDYCRPNVTNPITELRPEVILLMGNAAVKSVLGWLWREAPGPVSRWEGFRIPSQRLNAWVCPVVNPAALLHDEDDGGEYEGGNKLAARAVLFERRVKAACSLKGRPWSQVPDYAAKVECLLDETEAVRACAWITDYASSTGRPVAIDYETTTLKPDGPHAEIVCCSLSTGARTVAYPWGRRTAAATRALLTSGARLIASNLKMETRWTLAKLGLWLPAEQWWVDTMNGAHVLDNRFAICSIKFQAFALLGQDDWGADVHPYLKSDGANEPNRIREFIAKFGWKALLTYCGMDSLLEWLVARRQAPGLGVEVIL